MISSELSCRLGSIWGAAKNMTEVIGIDHIYISVSDFDKSKTFYDRLMGELGFLSNDFELNDDPHVHYYNRYFGFVIRPAKNQVDYSPQNPGMHHFCFRVESCQEIDQLVERLSAKSIDAAQPKFFPEYAPDYYATYISDPDGIKLEITNFRDERKNRYENWSHRESTWN